MFIDFLYYLQRSERRPPCERWSRRPWTATGPSPGSRRPRPSRCHRCASAVEPPPQEAPPARATPTPTSPAPGAARVSTGAAARPLRGRLRRIRSSGVCGYLGTFYFTSWQVQDSGPAGGRRLPTHGKEGGQACSRNGPQVR